MDFRTLLPKQNPHLVEAAELVARVVQEHAPNPQYSNAPRAFIVGGFVRDTLRGAVSPDLDMEIFGISPEDLTALLEQTFPGRVFAVGSAFGILTVALANGLHFDVALPRRESKVGKGHRGFEIESDPGMDLTEAARRRDFTVNAMSADPLTGELFDAFNGQTDLRDRILRATDLERFPDDPLRVWRAVQLSARLNFSVEPATLKLLQTMVQHGDLAELPKERITEEFRKLLLLAEQPSIGFELMKQIRMLAGFPELNALEETPQEPEWHPEGDVWIHTKMVVDVAAQIIRDPSRNLIHDEPLEIMLGALCHDLGKPPTTNILDGRIRSRGHEEAGVLPTKTLLGHFSFSEKTVRAVASVVADHLKPRMLLHSKERGELTEAQYIDAVRRLLKRLRPASWRVLIATAEADYRGRGIEAAERVDVASALMQKTILEHDLDRASQEMLLQGQDLLDLGVPAGPLVGKLLERIEDARDNGQISTREQAIDFARELIEMP
jgi:tRNA nucleotidyltransferase (CCA-adding enzyme)